MPLLVQRAADADVGKALLREMAWYDRYLELGGVDRIATGDAGIADVGWELFHLMLDIASGRKTAAADRLGLRNDLVLFNPAPIT